MSEVSFSPPIYDNLSRRFRDALPPVSVCALAALVGLIIPFLLLRYPMDYVIAGVVGLLGMAFVITCPYVGLLIFLGLLYLRPEENFPELAGARFTLMVSLAVFFAWLINALLCRERFHFRLPVVQSFLGFLVIAVVSTAISGAESFTDEVLELLKLLILFVLIVHLVNSERRLGIALGTLVLFTVILGARTIWQFQNGQSLVFDEGTARAQATGIFGDPNDLALAMAMALPIALGAAFSKGGWWTRLWSLAVIPILFWTIYVTDSRGGMMAVGASVLVFFGRRLGRVGLIVGALAAFALFTFGPSRMSQMSADEESAHERVVAWQAGLDMLRSNPLCGVGKGQFTEHHYRTAHNSIVLCLGELGLAGTALWLGLFYFAFRDGRRSAAGQAERAAASDPEAPDRPPRLPLLRSPLLQTSLITFLVGGFFLSRTYTPPLYVYLGLTVAAAQVEADRSGIKLLPATRRDWRNIGLLTLGAWLLVVVLVRLWE